MKEINWRMDRIVDRQNRDSQFDAKLHKMEIRTPGNDETIKLTTEQERSVDLALEAAMQRKAKEYGRRRQN